jgi:hypothetical protein
MLSAGLRRSAPRAIRWETIKKIVAWEDFRADIEAVTETKPKERKSTNAADFTSPKQFKPNR